MITIHSKDLISKQVYWKLIMKIMPTAHKAQKESWYQKICFCGGSKVLYCWDKVYNHWSGKNLLLKFVTFYIFLLDNLRYSESSAAVTQNIFKALNFISRCLWWHVMRWYCAEYCDTGCLRPSVLYMKWRNETWLTNHFCLSLHTKTSNDYLDLQNKHRLNSWWNYCKRLQEKEAMPASYRFCYSKICRRVELQLCFTATTVFN